jgi:tRNA(Ile)-lysidine synthase
MNLQESQKLETKLLTTLKNHLQAGDTVIAGISGGPDSIFLLYLLEKLPIKIIAAHVNHQLRKESNNEEEFVSHLVHTAICHDNCMTNHRQKHKETKAPQKKLASTLTFAPLTANIKSLSQKSKQGLEETGRKVRYDFFNKLAKKHQAKFIITAHHADDNLETIILNFARGASLQGLTGMQELETNSSTSTALLRPLLTISKKQILDFLKLKKLKFCVDKSNNSLVYKRNFIRHKIVPLLKEINPNISDTLAKNTENLREINEFLKYTAKDWIKKNAIDETFKKFDAENFRTLTPALQKTILLQIHEHHFGNIQNIQSSNIEETLSLINKNIGNKKKKFGQAIISIRNNIISL